MENTAKIFICNHPTQLFLYKNFIEIIRKYDQGSKIILFKVNHPHFLRFNAEPYRQYFDEIIEFDFIHYKKNIFLEYRKIFNFIKKLKKTIKRLTENYETIDAFSHESAWLPTNVLLYYLGKGSKIKINRFVEASLESSYAKTDKIKTLLCGLYSLPFKCYKVKVISTPKGRFLDFVYVDNVPGKRIQIISPTGDVGNLEKENTLPYPIVRKFQEAAKRDMVIIFGNAALDKSWSEYLPDYKTFVEKLAAFFIVFEKKYADCKLYYKPHPGDGKAIMPGIDIVKYSLFENIVYAQTIFDMYRERIKAVYTFSSTSIIVGSFFGIPSYTFYQYICNPAGIERFNVFFNQEGLKSKFIFHITNLDEIGKIDGLSANSYLDFQKLENKYRKALNV